MAFLRRLRSERGKKRPPAEARLSSPDAATTAALNGLVVEIRAIRLEVAALRHDFAALNAFRLALQTKSWMEFHRRRSGRVAGGVARAATARRDAGGRYVKS
jgi:hypothetical protein